MTSATRADRASSATTPACPAIRATYRLQLSPSFGFREAAATTAYLAELGVSHVYASPCLQAARGSTHGYNVVDHGTVSIELGGESGHAELCAAARRQGLGVVIDIVPNHMAIAGRDNAWFWDVLENGVESPYAVYFDIHWLHPDGRGKLVLPVLGDRYGRALASGEIRLVRAGGEILVQYFDHTFPVSPSGVMKLVVAAAERPGAPRALQRFVASLHTLGAGDDTPPFGAEQWRAELAKLLCDDSALGDAIDEAVREHNEDRVLLHRLLEQQAYRLSFWRLAATDVNYRRFGDINELVALRTDRREVFDRVHARVVEWLRRGVVDGVRVDHIDGLHDPALYLHRLREAAPSAFVVVEKVLARSESLPRSWPVQGTTGYDFLDCVGGLFVDPRGEEAMTSLYRRITGEGRPFADVAHEKKRLVAQTRFAGEVNRLIKHLARAAANQWRYRDFGREELRDAVVELLATFPVYRTYTRVDGAGGSEQCIEDAAAVGHALAEVARRRPDIDRDLLALLGDVLLLRQRGIAEDAFVTELQLVTCRVMGKGVEDTAFYCYNRLSCLNEVGGDPGRFGSSLAAFHRFCERVRAERPRSLLATSTHDTKRSEDVRARLALLSEMPERWSEAVQRWMAHAERYRRGARPDPNAIYLFFQTVVGAHPLPTARAQAYMLKACREAKDRTSWTDPDHLYERALSSYVEEVLADPELAGDVAAFVATLVAPGRTNALAQKLLALTSPGIPDIYQGTELWDLSLVDPDNRRPVDFDLRRTLLRELSRLSPREVLERADEGLPKMLVVQRALQLRRRHPDLFGPDASYEPLFARGEKCDHVVAFVRGGGAITVVPRLVVGLGGDWGDTQLDLPRGPLVNVFTGISVNGGRVSVGKLLDAFPVALFAPAR
jgi:(1->4)-alpha-D-glucan 1-alpha-D-glucosylmutase